MAIKIIKKSGKTTTATVQNESALARLRARSAARSAARKAAEALVAAKKARKQEGDGEGDGEQVDDISLDADTASVIFSDKDANIQVVVGEDPEGGITVAVATAEKGNLEDEEVLASVTVGEGDAPAGEGDSGESAKNAAVEEARAAIRKRLQR